MFVAFSAGPLPAATETALARLAEAGHPVLCWSDRDSVSLGAEFLRWEIATVTASAVLGVDPFDEPNVTEAKQATQAVLDRRQSDTTPHALDEPNVKIDVPEILARGLKGAMQGRNEPATWAAALLTLARAGDYFAVLAYLHRTPARHEVLQKLRHAARGAARIATTLGYGPRFLHSTGQLHKGGAENGIFLQITAEDGEDVPIPGAAFTFGQLIRAQAAGDYEVLERRGRRVVHVHLGRDVGGGLEDIAEAIATVRV